MAIPSVVTGARFIPPGVQTGVWTPVMPDFTINPATTRAMWWRLGALAGCYASIRIATIVGAPLASIIIDGLPAALKFAAPVPNPAVSVTIDGFANLWGTAWGVGALAMNAGAPRITLYRINAGVNGGGADRVLVNSLIQLSATWLLS